MSRNKVFNNLDYVRLDLKPLKTLKESSLESWLLFTYTFLRIKKTRIHDQGYLLNIISLDDSYTIFSLFFSYKII